MKIAVLITCHNRRETTLRCLTSLRTLSATLPIQVFLVDDGSTDGTREEAERMFECSNVRNGRVIRGDGTLFWAKGMALAWRTAVAADDFDFYLWLNDDVLLKPDAILQAIEDWKACGDERGVIVGACSTNETERQSSYSATTSLDIQIFPNGRTPQRADGWFNGNFVLVPRMAYEQIGIISDEYSHARADYDYAERLKRAGIPFFCSSHFVGVCVKDWAEKIKGYGLWDRIRTLWTPGYSNLADLFRFKFRYFGFWRAMLSVGHMIVVVIRG